MPFSTHARVVNPRLGTYFSIFAALFAALFLLALIFDRLGVSDERLRWMLLLGTLVLFGSIAAAVATKDVLSYFTAGRRVPAFYGGVVLGLTTLGSTFAVAGTGAFFFAGFDALVLLVGILSGLVLMAIVLAPFYRKFGAYTVPSYLGRRFESKALRMMAASVSVIAILLVLAAELRTGSGVAARLTGLNANVLCALMALYVAVTVVPGGKRSLTWVSAAQVITFLLALMTVATMVSIVVTNLPVPQLANGPLVRGLVRQESVQGLSLVSVWPLAFELPSEGFQQLSKPYTQAFGTVGSLAFVIGALTIGVGIAAAPWLLPRVAAAPGVYEARKSLGWATVFAGITLLTLTSAAIFLRDSVLQLVLNATPANAPPWIATLKDMNLVEVGDTSLGYTFTSLRFHRDGILQALPVAIGLPLAFSHLIAVGAIALALATANATAFALGTILTEDVVQGMSWEPIKDENRVWMARGFIALAALTGAVLALSAPTDPLRLVFWALSLTGAALFPILALSIWWKRITRLGAIVGLASGATVATLAIFAGEAGLIGIPGPIAGCLAVPVCAAAAMITALIKPEAVRHDLEMVRDIRVPGGQIIYDREMQRLQLKRQSRHN